VAQDNRSTDAQRAEIERARVRRWLDAQRAQGDVRSKVCSGVMDDATCEECASWDGVELELDDERLQLPNARCTCEDGCRCVWTLVLQSESPHRVGSQRRPPR
jgi:hypothetical protein